MCVRITVFICDVIATASPWCVCNHWFCVLVDSLQRFTSLHPTDCLVTSSGSITVFMHSHLNHIYICRPVIQKDFFSCSTNGISLFLIWICRALLFVCSTKWDMMLIHNIAYSKVPFLNLLRAFVLSCYHTDKDVAEHSCLVEEKKSGQWGSREENKCWELRCDGDPAIVVSMVSFICGNFTYWIFSRLQRGRE